MYLIRHKPIRRSKRRAGKAAAVLRFILISCIFIGMVAVAASLIASRARATSAQAGLSDGFWRDVKEDQIENRESRTTFPTFYRTVRLETQAFQQMIARAP